MNQRRANEYIEKSKAVEKKKLARRIKQYFMLSVISLPLCLYLGYVFEKNNLHTALTVVIFSAILLALWGVVLWIDKLISKRAKKLRQIKNAQAIVNKYNEELKKQKEAVEQTEEKETTIEKDNIKIETAEEEDKLCENSKEEIDKNQINLPKNNKSVNLKDIDKKQKIKQKKYGNFKSKRKK